VAVLPGWEEGLNRLDLVWAGATGLEPAASGVTGRRSNQLNYAPAQGTMEFIKRGWPFLTFVALPGALFGGGGIGVLSWGSRFGSLHAS
jgi:hypothetical protein